MDPYEALYGRKYHTPLNWYELKDREVLDPELIQEVEEKIQVIQNNLKAVADKQKSYTDLKRKKIEFQRYRSGPSNIMTLEKIEVQPDLTYEEEPVQILAHEVKQLRNKTILLIKVLLRNHKVEKAMWEREEDMRNHQDIVAMIRVLEGAIRWVDRTANIEADSLAKADIG
ncbi:uncharacterized protein LOC120182569 [Hibiscus syriacus]|uniref:uncharacterized protein LOC120182569 n=1 Tax=Hibiscus syriacus TaxID=106335 RepID=UPI0019221C9B|nr:uncharacterized protein LOC120182569 [Hibiscus syriacus]